MSIKMPTAIYDSSLLTYRKRAGTLSYYYQNSVSIGGTFPAIGRPEQANQPLAEVILARKQGGCTDCGRTSGATVGIGPCGCAR